MIKKLRGILTYLLIACLMLPGVPATAQAAAAPSPVTLKQAIAIIRDQFAVPAQYRQFESGYAENDGRKTWSLSWRSAEDLPGSFSAEVDAQTGEIVRVNNYVIPVDTGFAVRIPAVSQEKARQIAAGYLKKLAASKWAELKPTTNQPVYDTGSTAPSYTFRWQRIHGGIPVTQDQAMIEIDKQTGQLSNYQLNWTAAEFPDTKQAVAPEKASKAFTDAGMFELQYFIDPGIIPLNTAERKEKPAQLVYRLIHKSGGVIDALTGQPLVLPAGQFMNDVVAGMGGYARAESVKSPSASTAAALTPEEIKEIQKAESLISQQDAETVIKNILPQAASMTLRSASLDADWSTKNRIWNINYTGSSSKDGQSSYLYGRVDAQNGELMSFSYNQPETDTQTKFIDYAASKKLAEDLINRLQPEKSKQTRLSENDTPLSEKETDARYRYFFFTRLQNGIPVQNQGFSLSVNCGTGQVSDYNMSWPTQQFPSTAGVLKSDAALNAYFKQLPLTLVYARITQPSGLPLIRLVYMPYGSVSAATLQDAATGRLIDWQGKPVDLGDAQAAFTDIKGCYAQEAITILGEAGFFREYKTRFQPNQPGTLGSLLRALILAKEGDTRVYDQSDSEIMQRALQYKWVVASEKPSAVLTREKMGRLLITAMNLEPAARLNGIYVKAYIDINQEKFGGYAALLKGMGIMQGDSGHRFNPNKTVTRADEASAIYRMLTIRR